MTIAVMTSGGGRAADAQANPQTFKAGVDLIIIDVQISPSSDAAMRDFIVSDFDIRIAGRKRPAVSATRLHYDEGRCGCENHRRTLRSQALHLEIADSS
jgi:hypothetical protein